jgi:hypothetical protein
MVVARSRDRGAFAYSPGSGQLPYVLDRDFNRHRAAYLSPVTEYHGQVKASMAMVSVLP